MHERIRLPHLMIVIAVSATVLFVLLPFRPEPGLIAVSYAVFVLLPLSAAFLLLLDNAWESYLEYLLAVTSFYPPHVKNRGTRRARHLRILKPYTRLRRKNHTASTRTVRGLSLFAFDK